MDKYLSYLLERKVLAISGIVAVTVLGAVLFNQSTQTSTEATVNDPTSTCTLAAAIPTLTPGQSFQPSFKLTNKGTNAWTATPTPWAYPLYPGSGFAIYATNDTTSLSTWGTTRLPLTTNVAPGASVTITPPSLTAPTTPGSYPFSFQIGEKGFGRFGTVCSQTVTVKSPTSTAPTISISYATNPNWSWLGGYYAVSVLYPQWQVSNATSCTLHLSSAVQNSVNQMLSYTYAAQIYNSSYPPPKNLFKDGMNFPLTSPSWGTPDVYIFQWLNKCFYFNAGPALNAAEITWSQAFQPGAVTVSCTNANTGQSATLPFPAPTTFTPSLAYPPPFGSGPNMTNCF